MSDVTRVVFDGHDFVEPVSNNTPPATAPAPTPAPTIQNHDGVMRHQVGVDGSVESTHDGVTRMDVTQLFTTDETGILATAKSSSGRPLSGSEITPDSIVSFNGTTMSVKIAQSVGLIKQDANGRYVSASAAEQEQALNGTKPEEAEEREAFTKPEDEAALTAFAQTVPSNFQHSLVAAVIGGQEIPRSLIEDAAAQMGTPPAAFAQSIQAVFAAFQNQAVEAMQSLGGFTDPAVIADFDQWAEANHRDEVADAIRQQVYARSTKGWKALATKYLNTHAPTAEALRAAGYKTGRAGNGKTETVIIDGVEMPISVAAKQGLI